MSIGLSAALFKVEAPVSTEGESSRADAIDELSEVEEAELLDDDLDETDELFGDSADDGKDVDGDSE